MKQNEIKYLIALINEIAKPNSRFLYTEVPKAALESIMKFGLMSAKQLINKKDLLKLSRPKKKDYEDFVKKVSDAKDPPLFGPNAYIKLPPDDLELSKDHPSKKFDTVKIKIDIDALLKDEPKTRFYGMELEPFPYSKDEWFEMSKKEQKKAMEELGDSREKFIDLEELDDLLNRSKEDLWSHYDKKSSLYAGDVPHVAIITPSGVIDKKYLKTLK